jgi:hypothetical protein
VNPLRLTHPNPLSLTNHRHLRRATCAVWASNVMSARIDASLRRQFVPQLNRIAKKAGPQA